MLWTHTFTMLTPHCDPGTNLRTHTRTGVPMGSNPYPYPYPLLVDMLYPYPFPYPWSRDPYPYKWARTRTHTQGSYPYPYPYPKSNIHSTNKMSKKWCYTQFLTLFCTCCGVREGEKLEIEIWQNSQISIFISFLLNIVHPTSFSFNITSWHKLTPKGLSSPENGSFVAGRTWDGSFVATLT